MDITANITVSEEKIKYAVIERIANSIAYDHELKIRDKIKKALDMIDQATISRMVTEYLVAEHIGKMRKEEHE